MTIAQRLRSGLGLATVWIAVVIVLFMVIEGGSSVLLTARDYRNATTEFFENNHAPDSLLGWVNIPNFSAPDMYGRGVRLQINAQGFRADGPTTTARTPGTTRVICSGDSFTLGYGVANDRTWCHLLATARPRVESVNMGQGGYGMDQAYLWYLRDGRKVDHDMVIMAMITPDLERVMTEWFGRPKPRLSIDHDTLILHNVPVPRAKGRWLKRVARAASGLRVVVLGSMLGNRLGLRRPAGPRWSESEALDVSVGIFSAMKTATAGKNSKLAIVWLPHRPEYGSLAGDSLRARLGRELSRRNIAFIDLVPSMRALPIDRVDRMFIPRTGDAYRALSGHYTVEGNEWVARTLHDALVKDPSLAPALGVSVSPRGRAQSSY